MPAAPKSQGESAKEPEIAKAKTIRVGVRTKHTTTVGEHSFAYNCAGHRFHQRETEVEVTEAELEEIRSKSHALLVRVLDGTDVVLPSADELLSKEKVIDALREEIASLSKDNRNLRAALAAYKNPEDESDVGAPARPAAPAGLPRMG